MYFCQKFQMQYYFFPQDLPTGIKALAGSWAQGNERIPMYDSKPRIAKRVIQMQAQDREESDSDAITELVEPAFNGQKMFISWGSVSTNTEQSFFPCIKMEM